MNPTVSEAISNFLKAKTHLDLANLYNLDMEVQVNPSSEGGTRVDKEYKGKRYQVYTDGITTWKPIRIPYNANNNPEYKDYEIQFDLAKHAEGIGMTGWNWKEKRSVWVGYDFDALIGHSYQHDKKLSNQELEEIKRRLASIEWVTIRRSTSGNGLHIYVFILPSYFCDNQGNSIVANQIENHTEHAALARAILSQLSLECNYQFENKVDVVGGILWQWHRKLDISKGLVLIKQGTLLNKIPRNWPEHIPIILGKQSRPIPSQLSNSENNSNNNNISTDITKFDLVCGQRIRTRLTQEHYKLLEYLEKSGYYCSWDSDRWMLITHTCALQKAHQELNLKGVFTTLSEGTDPNTPNCYAFPLPNKGAWVVRRYGIGTAETDCWGRDASGWTRTYLNRIPDLETVSKIHGGVQDSKNCTVFSTALNMSDALNMVGISNEQLGIPYYFNDRRSKVKQLSQQKILIEIASESKDPDPNAKSEHRGWLLEKKWWQKVINLSDSKGNKDNKGIDNTNNVDDTSNFDDIVRHVVSQDHQDMGWYIKTDEPNCIEWNKEPYLHVKSVLEGPLGFDVKGTKSVIGTNILKPWTLVNIPFQPEYPGERKWNLNAAQLRFVPSNKSVDLLYYPTWLSVLNHCGKSIDNNIKQNKWCKENVILSGADYLLCWIACSIQFPYARLPYLFFYGPEDSGKSTFHEALKLLITKGYVKAEESMTSQGRFNYELNSAIYCIIEEIDLKKDKAAYMKIKDWTTGSFISIHEKHQNPILVPNTTKWIQCANSADHCPIFTGDTRITMIRVDPIIEEIKMHRDDLEAKLNKEAPDFLAKLLSIELPRPDSRDRFRIPVITTNEKTTLQRNNQSSIEQFIQDGYEYCPGSMIKYDELFSRFKNSLDLMDMNAWTIVSFGKALPPQFPKGRSKKFGGQYFVGNIKYKGDHDMGNGNGNDSNKDDGKLILDGQWLITEENNNNEQS